MNYILGESIICLFEDKSRAMSNTKKYIAISSLVILILVVIVAVIIAISLSKEEDNVFNNTSLSAITKTTTSATDTTGK